MNSAEQQGSLLTMMQRCEETVGQLYRLFAAKFPQQKQLWYTLADAEIQHADWVRALRARLADGSVHLSEGHAPNMEQVQICLDRAAGEVAKAQQAEMMLIDAVSAALSVEKVLVEQDLFRFFEGDSPLLKTVLQSLADETDNHVLELQKLLDAAIA